MKEIEQSKSFKQWCIDNSKQDILNRWDYKMNNKTKPSEIYHGTEKKYYFKCPEGLHKSELKNINSFTSGHIGTMNCKACNSFAQWGITHLGEGFLDKYWDYNKNIDINPWEISYGSKKKIFIFCKKKDYHGSYEISPNNFVNGWRCPYCTNNNGKVHPLDSLGKLLENNGLLWIWSDKNKKSPYEYAPNSHQNVWWKCKNNIHEDYKRRIESTCLYNFRCPQCVQEKEESFLQEKVRLYLESLNNGQYTILHEYDCTIIPKNPKTNRPLPFDNEIKELKLIIEVNGSQHYNLNNFHKKQAIKNNTSIEYELHMQQVRDRYKRICAKLQGYKYLEIPYWTDNKDEVWKKLMDTEINKISEERRIDYGV